MRRLEPKSRKAVFYDAGGKRDRYTTYILFGIFVLSLVLIEVVLRSLFVAPQFPELALDSPSVFSRSPIPAGQQRTTPTLASRGTLQNLLSLKPGGVSATPSQVVGFFVNWDDNSFESLKANLNTLDVLIPEWLHVGDAEGALLLDDPERESEVVTYLQTHRADLPVHPLINNYDPRTDTWDGGTLSSLLAKPETRRSLVNNLSHYIQDHRYGGVSIDFENLPEVSQTNLLLFMEELSQEFHSHGLVVSQAIPLDDDSYNAALLGPASDFLILMAYDEHAPGEGPQGGIASEEWYAYALAERFRQQAPEKYVVGLGGYGYDWKGIGTQGEDVTFEQAMRLASRFGSQVGFDDLSHNPAFTYRDETGDEHHVWYLDGATLFNEMAIAEKLGHPGGFALWRLGSEDPSVWKVFAHRTDFSESAAQALQEVAYGYDVSYEGTGEILQLSATPQKGSRTLEYDTTTGLLSNESMTRFPRPYVMNRWGASDPKKIAITFDDGPDPLYTPQILQILKKYKVPATFFVIGLNANLHPEILKTIVESGSEIGNHTYSHPNITAISQTQFRLELDATERVIEGVTGRKSLLFRPPYAEDTEPSSPEEVAPLLFTRALGYYTVGMHIDPHDWGRPGVETIVSEVLTSAERGDGNVVLLHDSGGNRVETVQALPLIIEGLQAKGFTLVGISELMNLPPEATMPPVSTNERLMSYANGVTFFSLGALSQFLKLMFMVGIALGIFRFFFLSLLAIYHAARVNQRKGWLEEQEKEFRASVAVVIPAYNEEKVIVRTVQSVLDSDVPLEKIIVVDDASTDRTLAVLEEAFGSNPQVHILAKEHSGKARSLNLGIRETEADIIIMLDADTLFRKDTIRKLIRHFADPSVGGVAGNAKVGNRINLLTRWQALEYITSQNLDRRAFEVVNCIPVIPGAVGAWRRSAVLSGNGFSGETLAEDADLTWRLLRQSVRVVYEEEAIGYTEAPDTVKTFMKQRFRWMYGMFQTAWKHFDMILRPMRSTLGLIAIPNVLIYQIFFPLISPLMDLLLVATLLWALWQRSQHPFDFSTMENLKHIVLYYLLFLILDFSTALIPFVLEKKEKWRLLWWLPFQRFFYRQLLYIVAIRAMLAALKGSLTRWGKLERKATAEVLSV